MFLLYTNIHALVTMALDTTWILSKHLYEKTGKICLAISENSTVQSVLIHTLWTYCRTVLWIETVAHYTYMNYSIVKTVCDYAVWTKEQVELLFSSYRREPDGSYWVSLCSLSRPPLYSSLAFFEAYQILNKVISNELLQSFAYSYSITEHDPLCKTDMILIAKNEEMYKIVRYPGEPIDAFVPSSYRLLSVSYTHPSMKEPVPLDIPNGMMLIGNELFSPCFVRRCLEYQSRPFVFDMDYRLEMIDRNVKCFTLTSDDYLVLGEKEALVKYIR